MFDFSPLKFVTSWSNHMDPPEMNIRKIIRSPLVVILLSAMAAYWPVAFCVRTFRWDMLDVVFPFRYFAGECIRNGMFPLWNPYQLTGVPVYADPQYPIWSPELWVIGLTTGYSIYTLHFLFISYLVLAGYGMYRLVLHFHGNRTAALTAGIAYMLCGFFTGHGQALFSIIGAAFLPWVVLYMIKNCTAPSLLRTLKLAIFIFLMVTTGYQFISIITAYLLLAIMLYYFFAVHLQNRPLLIKWLKFNGLLVLLVLLLCLTVMVPVVQAAGYVDRISKGLPYHKSIICSFTWQSLISLVTPFATVKYPEFFNTDISMRNMYPGLIVLVIFMAGIFRKKSGIHWLILAFGAVCLLASFGEVLPVHKIMFHYVPFIHMLRMPAYFNLFTLFAMILSAGIQIPRFLRPIPLNQRSPVAWSILFICLLALLTGYSFLHKSDTFPDISLLFSIFDEFLKSLNFHEHILLQAPLQIMFLLVLLAFLTVKTLRPRLGKAILLLVCCEMIIAVNLNSYFTVYSAFRPGHIRQFMKRQPAGFPVPENTAIAENSDKNLTFDPLWRNMGILTKKLSYDGFSSFILKSFNYMDDSLPDLRDALIRNPPVYLSGKIYKNSQIRSKTIPAASQTLCIPDTVFSTLPADLKKNTSHDNVQIKSFSPVKCSVTCTIDSAAVITYLQASYPGWKVTLDGKKTTVFTSNFMYISALVPAGKHYVTFIYENRPVWIAFIISYAAFIMMLAMITFLSCSRRLPAGFARQS